MRSGGFFDEAGAAEKDYLGRQVLRADIGSKQATGRKSAADAAKTETEAVGLALGQYQGLLAQVNSPQAARVWMERQFSDPRLAPILGGIPPEKRAELFVIPEDPQAFAQWRDQAAVGIAKYQDMMAARARDAEAARSNQAREGLTAASQRDASQRGWAQIQLGRAAEARQAGVAQSEAGGPGQAALVARFGKPPKDYRWKDDGSAEPIPGGPADIKAGELGEKRDMTKQAITMQANTVLDTVNEARELVGITTTGVGGLLANLPATSARNLQAKLTTIKANLGFDRLQQMRDMSPTGGALGSVAVQELTSLQATIASLDQLQQPEELRAALDRIEGHYRRWLEVVGAPRRASGPQLDTTKLFSEADAIIGGK
jgi:hypothetical protein